MTIPSGYAQANLIFTGSELPNGAQCVLGLDISEAPIQIPATIANEVVTQLDAVDFADLFVSTVTLDRVMVKFGPDATGLTGEAPAALGGLSSGEGISPQVATLVKKSTALGGRKGRGRMYIPGTPESVDAVGGSLDSGFVTAVNTCLNDFLDNMAGVSVPLVLLHGDNTTPTPLVSFACQSLVATQRRRIRP